MHSAFKVSSFGYRLLALKYNKIIFRVDPFASTEVLPLFLFSQKQLSSWRSSTGEGLFSGIYIVRAFSVRCDLVMAFSVRCDLVMAFSVRCDLVRAFSVRYLIDVSTHSNAKRKPGK